jgi:hypothetical protein
MTRRIVWLGHASSLFELISQPSFDAIREEFERK